MEAEETSLVWALGLTSVAAGLVDVISFTKLGGVFASAMTGNLALLALYLAAGKSAAVGSLVALAGFVAGGAVAALMARGRGQFCALRWLLVGETGLLAAGLAVWMATGQAGDKPARDGLIALLALAMGVQSIVGKRLNLSSIPTIVFTSTLTNIVVAMVDMLRPRGRGGLPLDTRRQMMAFGLYFAGALLAGIAVVAQAPVLMFLPVGVVAVAAIGLRGKAGA